MEVGNLLPRRWRGLTIIELITTLAVAGISLAVIVPSWAALADRSRVTTAANDLLGSLRYARNEAVHRHATVSVCPSTDADTCTGNPTTWHLGYLVFLDPNRNRTRDTGEQVQRYHVAANAVLNLHSTAARPAVRFDTDGAAWGTNTTFSICAGNAAGNRAVILHGTGRARVDDKTGSGNPVTCT